MGGAPQAVRFLALAAFAACVVGVGCSDGDPESLAEPHRVPGHVSSRRVVDDAAGAGARADAGGAPGDTLDPVAAGAPSARIPIAPLGAGGADDRGARGDAGAPPGCGSKSGAVCGADMAPASDPAMRYFCSEGVLIAQARCPGVCMSTNNACGMSTGTGGGVDGAGLGVTLHCRGCLADICAEALDACDADTWCAAHMDCLESCTVDEPCLSICAQTFPHDPLLDRLGECAVGSECPPACGGH